MDTLTLNSKGQITIPAHVRKEHGLVAGDSVKIFSDPEGHTLTLKKTTSIRDLFGILPRPDKAATIKEMNEAVGRAITERVLRK
jgi:antitoxin PrlF